MKILSLTIGLFLFIKMQGQLAFQDLEQDVVRLDSLIFEENKILEKNRKEIRFIHLIECEQRLQNDDDSLSWLRSEILEIFSPVYVSSRNCRRDANFLKSYVLVFRNDQFLGEIHPSSNLKIRKSKNIFRAPQVESLFESAHVYYLFRKGGNMGQLNFLFTQNTNQEPTILVEDLTAGYSAMLLKDYIECCWLKFKSELRKVRTYAG